MGRRDDAVRNVTSLRRASRVAGATHDALRSAAKPLAGKGFPYRKPTTPRGVHAPSRAVALGADYETAWARRYPARLARVLWVQGPLRAFTKAVAAPQVKGADRLEDVRTRTNPPPLIFTPNHHSHLDTMVSVYAIPEPWRHKLIVAAAADYFFTTRLRSGASALSLNALPLDRDATGRKSADQIRELMADGWSLLIYPEGGRSPDGWGQEFKGGAAYLSTRTGAPVVPMFIEGTGQIFGKGAKRLKPGRTTVVFGAPMTLVEGENTRRFGARIEAAVTRLGDETLGDAWSARRNAAQGRTPSLTGPAYTSWRRGWALTERRQLGNMGVRRRQKRRWPDLG